ncbi:hypothetical protein DENSPDRAFT_852013 [Dentipellis sp. KUC8613]|nr:hypothetical protein DENSPDRAFT_852013 [Dentipellis sp. KUC8613]
MAKKSTARSTKSAVSDAVQEALAPMLLLLEQQQAAIAALQRTAEDNQRHLRTIHQAMVDAGTASQHGLAATEAAASSGAPSVTVSSPSPSPTLSAPDATVPAAPTDLTPSDPLPLWLQREAAFQEGRPRTAHASLPPRCPTPRPPFAGPSTSPAPSSSSAPATVPSAASRVTISALLNSPSLPPAPAPAAEHAPTSTPAPTPRFTNPLRREDPTDPELQAWTSSRDLSELMGVRPAPRSTCPRGLARQETLLDLTSSGSQAQQGCAPETRAPFPTLTLRGAHSTALGSFTVARDSGDAGAPEASTSEGSGSGSPTGQKRPREEEDAEVKEEEDAQEGSQESPKRRKVEKKEGAPRRSPRSPRSPRGKRSPSPSLGA